MSAKRTIEVDPVSQSHNWLDDGECFTSSSSSEEEQEAMPVEDDDEMKQRLIRMQSFSPIVVSENSEPKEVDALQTLQNRIDEIEKKIVMRQLPANSSAANTLLQGLLDFGDLMILVNVWGINDEVVPESSDHEIERAILYQHLLHRYDSWNDLLQHAIKTRIALMMSGVREKLGPENNDHAIYTLFNALSIGKIIAKRVFKRQMSVNIGRAPARMHRLQIVNDSMEGYVTDIWTSKRHLAKDLQMQSQPIVDANNRPIVVKDERGNEKILTEERDPNVELVKLKGIMFFQQPIDIDPSLVVK
jgi:hypothetical protein